MKKIFTPVALLFVLASVATSCSKTYNCHCVYKDNGVITREDDYKINEGKKSKSEAKCNEMDASNTFVLGGNTYNTTTECTLQ